MNIREEVSVSADGNHYRGTFTLHQYDPSGKKLLGDAEGVVTVALVTIDSTAESIYGGK